MDEEETFPVMFRDVMVGKLVKVGPYVDDVTGKIQ